jgi:hypothetical protein
MYTYLLPLGLAISISIATAASPFEAEQNRDPLPEELKTCVVREGPTGNFLLQLTEEQYQRWFEFIFTHTYITIQIKEPNH